MLGKKEFTELESGWMSPDGEFFPCGYMEHSATAEKISGSIWGDVPWDPEDRLMENGWLQIGRIMFGVRRPGFVFFFKGHLSPEQVHLLKPLAEEAQEDIFNYELLEEEFDR